METDTFLLCFTTLGPQIQGLGVKVPQQALNDKGLGFKV